MVHDLPFRDRLKLPMLLKSFGDLHVNVSSELGIDLHLLRSDGSIKMNLTGEIDQFLPPNASFCYGVVSEKASLNDAEVSEAYRQ